jgi:hypothetical protein
MVTIEQEEIIKILKKNQQKELKALEERTHALFISKIKELQDTLVKEQIKQLEKLEKKLLEKQNEEILKNRKDYLKKLDQMEEQMDYDIRKSVLEYFKNKENKS